MGDQLSHTDSQTCNLGCIVRYSKYLLCITTTIAYSNLLFFFRCLILATLTQLWRISHVQMWRSQSFAILLKHNWEVGHTHIHARVLGSDRILLTIQFVVFINRINAFLWGIMHLPLFLNQYVGQQRTKCERAQVWLTDFGARPVLTVYLKGLEFKISFRKRHNNNPFQTFHSEWCWCGRAIICHAAMYFRKR